MFSGNIMENGHVNSQEVQAFRREASAVAEKLIQEHVRETVALYQDNQKIRQELSRVVEMMNNFLTREKQLHDMLATLTDSHTSISRDLHSKVQEAVGAGHKHAGDTKNKAGELMNLHTATIQELSRIKSILGSPSTGGPGMPSSPVPLGPGGLSPQQYQPASPPPFNPHLNSPPMMVPGGFGAPNMPQQMMPSGVPGVPPGYAAAMIYGEDRNRNGIPDIMEAPGMPQVAPPMHGTATPPAVFRMLP